MLNEFIVNVANVPIKFLLKIDNQFLRLKWFKNYIGRGRKKETEILFPFWGVKENIPLGRKPIKLIEATLNSRRIWFQRATSLPSSICVFLEGILIDTPNIRISRQQITNRIVNQGDVQKKLDK